ncbi:RICIN domain-containing protein [Streptomyces roseoverticillatus]|uniref:RICIN domain-containing protein n=1 Tax=Streptomyces roseoverticillatus TaxID=66429 RepID=UPI0033C1E559
MKTSAKFAAVAATGAALVMTAPGMGQAATPGGDLIVNTLTSKGKCLEIENSSTKNGAKAQQWTCKGQKGAFWRAVKVDEPYPGGARYQIVNVNSGKCLEIADSRKDIGAPVQQWTCVDGVATQLWYQQDGHLTNANSFAGLEFEHMPNGKWIDDGAPAVGALGDWWGWKDPFTGKITEFGKADTTLRSR